MIGKNILSSRIVQVSPSLTLEITAKAKELKKQGKDVINFAAGEPDFDTPDYIKEAAISAINEGFTKYTPATGIAELKEKICQELYRKKNLKFNINQIVIGCGAKHCLYNVFQVICSESDEVIIPSPYWLSYPEMVRLAQAKPVILETNFQDGFKINDYQLKNIINQNTKAFILNSPSNPTGSVYTKEELKNLCEVLKESNIFIISDEIYDELSYDDDFVSIASIDSQIKERTIVVGGVSKTYAMTGWRIGYLAGPDNIVKSIGSLQSHSTSNPCSISQKAALAALSKDDESVKQMIEIFDKRRKVMFSSLKEVSKINPFYPKGGFYIFCDISEVMNSSLEFSKKLLEDKNIAVIPGIAFGCEGYVRMSFATSMEQIEEGIKRIKEWINDR